MYDSEFVELCTEHTVLLMFVICMMILIVYLSMRLHYTYVSLEECKKELDDANDEIAVMNMEMSELKARFTETDFEKNNYKFVSETDKLTGILNKEAIERACRAKIDNKEIGALFVIDLDHFKEINDKMGHQEGDRILTMFAIKLSTCLRNGDLVGRFGGDEFIVYANGEIDRTNISHLAERINKVALGLTAENSPVQVSASIGISIYPEQGFTYDVLFKEADKAVYKVKEAGRNGYHIFNGD